MIRSADKPYDSCLESVDIAEAEAVQAAAELGFDARDVHKIRLSVREGMANAVVHGNRSDVCKKVHFGVSKGANSVTFVIRDEGEGFDAECVPDPLAEENLLKCHGRGLLMIREFMDEVEIRRVEPQGTELRMTKRVPQR